MKRTKTDRLFWIQFDQSNRDFLSNTATFMLSFAISLIALLLSVVAILIAINGINLFTMCVVIILSVIMIFASFWFSIKVKKLIKDSKNLNRQLQKQLFEQYPEYKNKYH
jgi:ABC-type bacteriocin/lantibiotic exporter with double-glycine peptidase domain